MKKTLRITACALALVIVFLALPAKAQASTGLLSIGSSGYEVTRLQQTLQAKGYFNHSVTGYFGTITRSAVISFQKANGLSADGIVGPITSAKLYSESYSAEDLYWMSRIIQAEAEGEPYRGKVAVGNVVMNRVRSSNFPNTVKSVIFQYYQGIPMFSPVADGTIYNTPNQDSINAAKDALNGVNPAGAALYFFNPAKSSAPWIVRNCTYVTTIGNHAFYK